MLGLLTVAIALLALTGYIYGVVAFYRISGFISMAFNTAIAFLLMGIGILAARPQFEPIATLLSEPPAGLSLGGLLPPPRFCRCFWAGYVSWAAVYGAADAAASPDPLHAVDHFHFLRIDMVERPISDATRHRRQAPSATPSRSIICCGR